MEEQTYVYKSIPYRRLLSLSLGTVTTTTTTMRWKRVHTKSLPEKWKGRMTSVGTHAHTHALLLFLLIQSQKEEEEEEEEVSQRKPFLLSSFLPSFLLYIYSTLSHYLFSFLVFYVLVETCICSLPHSQSPSIVASCCITPSSSSSYRLVCRHLLCAIVTPAIYIANQWTSDWNERDLLFLISKMCSNRRCRDRRRRRTIRRDSVLVCVTFLTLLLLDRSEPPRNPFLCHKRRKIELKMRCTRW